MGVGFENRPDSETDSHAWPHKLKLKANSCKIRTTFQLGPTYTTTTYYKCLQKHQT